MTHASHQAPRPDLGRRALLALIGWTLTGVAAAILAGVLSPAELRAPGSPLRQLAAIAAAVLMLTPFLFSVGKRAGFTDSPPRLFVVHAIASAAGIVLAFLHASGGKLYSPPGLLLVLGLLLVVQGAFARAHLSDRFATLFAAQVDSFRRLDPTRREQLARIIGQKQRLLQALDPQAAEALFSPNLRHWTRHPWLSLCYSRLAHSEARLVGSRRRAGIVLGTWRRIHIGCALLFLLGLVLHIVLVTFFAGYVAAGDSVYWWHVSTWGGSQ